MVDVKALDDCPEELTFLAGPGHAGKPWPLLLLAAADTDEVVMSYKGHVVSRETARRIADRWAAQFGERP